MPFDSTEEPDVPVWKLRNLGTASSEWLRDAGICTKADLQRLGAVAAYRLVKQRQPRATRNLLWALAAALADIDWRELSGDRKEQLQQEAEDEGW